jgi:kynurenine formamidase
MKLFLSQLTYIESSESNVRAWYLNKPEITPVRSNEFLGSVEEGGGVNFRNIFFNPHGHGTHTECCGHITSKVYSINQSVTKFIVPCQLISVSPEKVWNEQYETYDYVVTVNQLKFALKEIDSVEALVIRTYPNRLDKKNKNYSDTNPPYFEDEIVELLNNLGVKHFLTDLPSVDRELDGGNLAFHHRYWNVPDSPILDRTITELVYVDSSIEDGHYLLDLQIAPIENDASPSRPILYKIKTVTN